MSSEAPRAEALSLESLELGAHPLIAPLLERLKLRELLSEVLPVPERRAKLAPVDSALVPVRNFTLSSASGVCSPHRQPGMDWYASAAGVGRVLAYIRTARRKGYAPLNTTSCGTSTRSATRRSWSLRWCETTASHLSQQVR
jgi:hypothetical protein